jgi:hypothetical protein
MHFPLEAAPGFLKRLWADQQESGLLYKEKVSLTPNYGGSSILPPKLWNGLIYPLNFAKPAKSPPRAVLGGGLLQ